MQSHQAEKVIWFVNDPLIAEWTVAVCEFSICMWYAALCIIDPLGRLLHRPISFGSYPGYRMGKILTGLYKENIFYVQWHKIP